MIAIGIKIPAAERAYNKPSNTAQIIANADMIPILHNKTVPQPILWPLLSYVAILHKFGH